MTSLLAALAFGSYCCSGAMFIASGHDERISFSGFLLRLVAAIFLFALAFGVVENEISKPVDKRFVEISSWVQKLDSRACLLYRAPDTEVEELIQESGPSGGGI